MNDVIWLDNTVKRFANCNVSRNYMYQISGRPTHLVDQKNCKRLIKYGLLIWLIYIYELYNWLFVWCLIFCTVCSPIWWQVGCYNACLILIKKKSPDKKKPPVGVQLLSLINIVFLNKINRINYLNQEDYINKVFDWNN